MGSDNAHSTDSVPVKQEPESASGAKMKPSDGSNGADGSGPPSPSSRRHQEQVQNLKGKCEVSDGSKGPDENLIHETTDPLEKFTSLASMRSGSAGPTPLDRSCGGDGSGAPCPCSLTEEERVRRMLKKNCGQTFGFSCEYSRAELAYLKESPWFVRVVAKLGVEPRLNNSKVEIKEFETPIDLEKARLLHFTVVMEDLETTPSDDTGKGDRILSGTWSLTEDKHVRNLRENFRRVSNKGRVSKWEEFKDSAWFVGVVEKLRADPCLDNCVVELEEAPFAMHGTRRLHWAVLMGDFQMVQKILETQSIANENHIDTRLDMWPYRYSALDLAIISQESEIVDALLERNAKVNTGEIGSLQVVVFHAHEWHLEKAIKILQLLVRKEIDLNFKDECKYTAFYIVVAQGKRDIVRELLKWKDKIKLNEECRGGRPPIQIANQEGFKDIESELMHCEDVRRFLDSQFRDRQAYVDAANAILVGAALIASVTFASWLQPPLSYTMSYHSSPMEYVDVEHNFGLGLFWVFNTLSFYFAIGTVVFGAQSVLPRRQLFITENVKKLSQNLILTSLLLAFSVLFVIVAFGIAGIIVLIPILRYRWYMIGPTILGGIVCIGSIGYLFKSLWENRPWNNKNRKRDASEVEWMKDCYRYAVDIEESDGAK